jgi:hypothetical protein
MKKLNMESVANLILLVFFTYIFVSDWYLIIFKGYSFTWLGLITDVIAVLIVNSAVEYFTERVKR